MQLSLGVVFCTHMRVKINRVVGEGKNRKSCVPFKARFFSQGAPANSQVRNETKGHVDRHAV